MKNILVIIVLLSMGSLGLAQGEASYWYFGDHAGIYFDPNTGTPTALTDGALSTREGCASISDRNGNLLFYTDGRTVWDRNHVPMPGGTFDPDPSINTELFGDPSSSQSAIIVPNPSDTDIYYIFTVDEPHHQNAAVHPLPFTGNYTTEQAPENGSPPEEDDGLNNGLNYSIVDLSETGTLPSGQSYIGDVTSRNNPLVTYGTSDPEEIKYKCAEKITAVRHGTRDAFWVVAHFQDSFYAFLVDGSGVNEAAQTSSSDLIQYQGYRRNAAGYMKASPDGSKIAVAHSSDTNNNDFSDPGKLYVYDFDNTNGTLSNETLLNEESPYGVEFSPNSQVLYASVLDGDLYQYDLSLPSSQIRNSQLKIGDEQEIGALQLAIDGRIYVTRLSLFGPLANTMLSTINLPDNLGAACDFQSDSFSLNGRETSYGLPPFIVSFFITQIQATIEVSGLCQNNTASFTLNTSDSIDSVNWTFTSLDTSMVVFTSTAISPNFTFTEAGNYQASAEVTSSGSTQTFTLDFVIHEDPSPSQPLPYQLCDQGNDGMENFMLDTVITPQLRVDTAVFEVTYHTSPARDSTDRIIDPDNYPNASDPQTIYVKVANRNNTDCSDISIAFEISLTSTPITIVSPTPYVVCENTTGSGLGDFDLESEITPDLGIDATLFEVTYHTDPARDAASLIQDPSNYNDRPAQMIYINISDPNGTSCADDAIAVVDLIVNPSPMIDIQDQYLICNNDENPSSVMIDPGNYDTYEWVDQNSGETIGTNASFEASQGGTFLLRVSSTDNGVSCTAEETFTVTTTNTPVFDDPAYIITEQGFLVINLVLGTSDLSTLSDFEFAIDSPDGPYQPSNMFTDVSSGPHTVYVRNVYDICSTVSVVIDFFFIRIPKFFTPNGDTYHEQWRVEGLEGPEYVNTGIYIFDRFGKLLKQMDPRGQGWDGTYNNRPMPSTDYWYRIWLEDGREFKGHFTLKR